MRSIPYHRPRTVTEARSMRTAMGGARYIAGGTDLLVSMKKGTIRPEALISLRGIPELTGIEVGRITRIGALCDFGTMLRHAGLAERYGVLHQALTTLGSAQIRNQATLAGNLCNASPCADTALPLLVYGARLRILGNQGFHEVAIDDFFRGPAETCLLPGDILCEVLLEPPAPGARGAFRKHRRVHMDMSLVSVAVLLQMEGDRCVRARVAAGSAGPTPLRLRATEARLQGTVLEPEVVQEARALAAGEIFPIDDVRATAAYRRHMLGVLLERALREIQGRADP